MKKTLTPKLRFPEFRDNGDWKKYTLSDVLSEHGYKSTGAEEVFSVSVHKGLINQIKHLGRTFAASSTNNYNRVFPGDIVYTKSPTGDFPLGIIKQSKLDSPVIVSPLYGVFTPKTIAIGTILDTYFESPANLKSYLEPLVQKGAKNTINIKNSKFISGSFILPPNTDEQTKIADCFTSINELIIAQSRKLVALKTYKKGLMQQLLPTEGKTAPKLRFPEFRDREDWKLQKLETLARRGSGHTPNKKSPSYYNGGIKWVSLADSNKLDNRYIYATKIEISREGIKNSSAVLHDAGSVILSRDAGVGKSAVLHSEMAVSQHFIVWACDESKLSNWFLYYVLQTLKPSFERIAVGNTIKTIGLPYFKELCISAPSIREQQKIVDCLTSIDELITAHAQKLDALKVHKKGLVQKLLPDMSGVKA